MLKETETEENIVFFVKFLSLVTFYLGGPVPLATPTSNVIARGPWHLGDFCNIFLPNIGEDQKSLTI